MSDKYDAIVLGSGPAGGQVAGILNRAGKSVALAESYGFGGTCPLRGCEPKKLLVEHSFIVARSRDMAEHGLDGKLKIDWPRLMQFNRSFVDPVSDRVETYFNMKGVDTYFGPARFTGPTTVVVDDDEIEGENVIIATGAMPRPLDFEGADLVSLSDDFLEMTAMPKRIVFVGGGFISFELGHLAARVGAEVTILEVADRPLTPFDADMVKLLVAAGDDLGIKLITNSPVQKVEKQGNEFIVTAGDKTTTTYAADMVIHGAGRVPAIDALYLEKAGVDKGRRGIAVNEYMQSTSNPKVYAAGDCADTPLPLTPVASMEADVAAHNVLHGNEQKVDHNGIPASVFTYPVLASLGLREDQARDQGIDYTTIFKETADWSEHQRIGLKHAGFKLLIDEKNDRLVGAHILGERSEEIINVLAMSMRLNLTLSQIKSMVWSYPTMIYTLGSILP
jgi:glutathione reductase (NADPH)